MNQIQAWIERHFKNLEDVGSGFMLAAVAFVGVGNLLGIELLVHLGLGSVGAAVIAWGANAIQTRELTRFQRGIHVSERIQEFLARAWGILFIGGGMLLLGYGILSALNPRAPIPNSLRQFFATTQSGGVLLLIGASIGILFSVTLIFVSDAEGSNGFVRFILSLPGRLFGVVLLLFFGALGMLSVLQIFAPSVLENAWHMLLRAWGME